MSGKEPLLEVVVDEDEVYPTAMATQTVEATAVPAVMATQTAEATVTATQTAEATAVNMTKVIAAPVVMDVPSVTVSHPICPAARCDEKVLHSKQMLLLVFVYSHRFRIYF